MSLDFTTGASPIFLSRNFLTIDSENANDLIATSGQAYVHRLYDMDPANTYWTSVGSSDVVTEVITLGFYLGATNVSVVLDTIAVLNTNLKNFLMEYSNDGGATYTTVSGWDYTSSPNAATDIANQLGASITANKIRITMTTTLVANAEKQIGLLIFALASFQAKAMLTYTPARKTTKKEVIMADGTKDFSYIEWTDVTYELYQAKVKWQNLSASDRANLRTIATQTAAFIWWPEPGDLIEEVYLATMISGSYVESYSSEYKGSGRDVEMGIESVGGS